MRNDHIESEQIYETQHVRLIVIVIMQILIYVKWKPIPFLVVVSNVWFAIETPIHPILGADDPMILIVDGQPKLPAGGFLTRLNPLTPQTKTVVLNDAYCQN